MMNGRYMAIKFQAPGAVAGLAGCPLRTGWRPARSGPARRSARARRRSGRRSNSEDEPRSIPVIISEIAEQLVGQHDAVAGPSACAANALTAPLPCRQHDCLPARPRGSSSPPVRVPSPPDPAFRARGTLTLQRVTSGVDFGQTFNFVSLRHPAESRPCGATTRRFWPGRTSGCFWMSRCCIAAGM
jgi:hypothetical protein